VSPRSPSRTAAAATARCDCCRFAALDYSATGKSARRLLCGRAGSTADSGRLQCGVRCCCCSAPPPPHPHRTAGAADADEVGAGTTTCGALLKWLCDGGQGSTISSSSFAVASTAAAGAGHGNIVHSGRYGQQR